MNLVSILCSIVRANVMAPLEKNLLRSQIVISKNIEIDDDGDDNTGEPDLANFRLLGKIFRSLWSYFKHLIFIGQILNLLWH